MKLFKSYLKNYKLQVKVSRNGDYAFSKSKAIKSIKLGVPQGSILGPLIFITYINDFDGVLENVSRTSLVKYGDDISMRANTFPDLRHGIETAMKNAMNWFVNNRLSMKEDKTSLVFF